MEFPALPGLTKIIVCFGEAIALFSKNMSKHTRRSIEHSFRCKVWFCFFLVCAAVFFFPPWIISEKRRLAPFGAHWLTDWEFHFLAYQPPSGWEEIRAYGPNGCEEIHHSFPMYRHLDYHMLGIEFVSLGVIALILRKSNASRTNL